MKIATRIQHGGQRKRWADMLLTLIDDKNARIIDNTGFNLWQSARRTLLSYEPGDTHILVMQDDVLPCRDLVKTAYLIGNILGNQPVTFFSNSDAVKVALTRGIPWAQLTAWFMAQCYMLPVNFAFDMVTWIDMHVRPTVLFDDDRMATYCWAHKIKVWATAPCLVEHMGWNETTLGHYKDGHKFEPRTRMAAGFIGFERSGLDFDWSKINAPILDNSACNSMFCTNYD